MIKKFSFLTFLLLIVISFNGYSQKQLTLEDAVYMNPEIFPERLSQLQWMGERYGFEKDNQWIARYPVSRAKDLIVKLEDINEALPKDVEALKRFPRLSFESDNDFTFHHQNTLYRYSISEQKIEALLSYANGIDNMDYHKKSNKLAYTIDNNLFINTGRIEVKVTDDTDPGIVNGQTVHRVEFGINTGTFWSPNGKYLAFYRKDESMVKEYPLVDIAADFAEVDGTRYPMAGRASHHVSVGVYNLDQHKTIFLETGEPKDQYLTCVTWGPEEKYIYVALFNRDQNHMRLNKYEAATGKFVQTLFEEQDKEYVEPEHALYFLKNNPDQFIWFSERDGFQHLYLYKEDGTLIRQLTKGDWVVTDLYGLNENEEIVFFGGTKDSPIEQNIYSVHIFTGEVKRLSPDHGTHNALINKRGDYIIDVFSSTDQSRAYKILSKDGEILQPLLISKDPLEEYKLGEMEIFTLKADDGSDLYARLIKPANFDPSKKYPVFFYVYGGPHSQLVNDSWLGGAGIFLNYMAQQGYVVFTLDNHGTANRGIDFEQAIFRNLGNLEVADQMKGVEYLKSLDYVDPDRMGVDGWSYGGFMTISMMLKNPGVFKVACAGGPVIDWKYYEVMYGERYMDTPESNPEGYKNAALTNYVDQLEGKLMIIHGTMDPTVVWQNSLDFVKECVDAGKQLDYFVYPGHGHNVRGKDRMHLYEKISLYFDENL